MSNPWKRRVTQVLECCEKDHSQWGYITNMEWCQREAARMTGKGAAVTVLQVGNKCAIVKE